MEAHKKLCYDVFLSETHEKQIELHRVLSQLLNIDETQKMIRKRMECLSKANLLLLEIFKPPYFS